MTISWNINFWRLVISNCWPRHHSRPRFRGLLYHFEVQQSHNTGLDWCPGWRIVYDYQSPKIDISIRISSMNENFFPEGEISNWLLFVRKVANLSPTATRLTRPSIPLWMSKMNAWQMMVAGKICVFQISLLCLGNQCVTGLVLYDPQGVDMRGWLLLIKQWHSEWPSCMGGGCYCKAPMIWCKICGKTLHKWNGQMAACLLNGCLPNLYTLSPHNF